MSEAELKTRIQELEAKNRELTSTVMHMSADKSRLRNQVSELEQEVRQLQLQLQKQEPTNP